MKDIALLFPGQGAQKVGMGKDMYDAFPSARMVFDRADEVLGMKLTDVIFNGPEEQLMATSFCQPAIFTMSMAVLAVLRASEQFKHINVRYTAGLSLGEYGAMCAAGVLSFEDSLRLIRKRGALMEEAAKAHPGKMCAVLGFDKVALVGICREAGCEVANFNAPDQIVITGEAEAVDRARTMLVAAGCKKVIPLEVAGAFHSSLMRSAADNFAAELKDIDFKVGAIKVISNVTALPQENAAEIRVNLPKQIYSSVQWVDSVKFISSNGINDLVEVGPGRVLKGLIRKIDPALNVLNCQNVDDVSAVMF